MAKKKQILYPVIYMMIISIFFTFMLAFINSFTKDTIARQQELITQRSVLYTFNFDINSMTNDEIIDTFNDHIDTIMIEANKVFIYEGVGYAFQFTGKGLWGSITGHFAVDLTHENVLGINFIEHSETPGLGGRIDEEAFKDQFRNLEMTEGEPMITYNTASGGNVDSISGATLTSLAVREILNTKIPELLDYARKEGYYEGN